MSSPPNSWDAKYREARDQHAVAEPAPIVTELLPLLPRGAALDLACGAGRHALLLAQHGYAVTAVDASGAALDLLEERARRVSIKVCREESLFSRGQVSGTGLRLVQVDLEKAELPANSFDLIVCVNYLRRSLFPQMERALRPGGMLMFETFTEAQLDFAGGPRNPEFLLRTHELRNAFPRLRTIFYRELRAGKGIASLLASRHI
jgi:SAM-dependent methyltransferase